jgi:SAM-dependent methyltransferase
MRNFLIRVLGWRATVLQGDTFVPERWRWLRSYLRSGQMRTLDAGCGRGAFTFYAAQIGNEALGLTDTEADARVAEGRAALLHLRGARFQVLDLRTLDQSDLPPDSFDQIICCEVIEHVRDDAKLLADLARLLKPGGRLLLTTPYKHHVKLWREKVSEVEDGGHVRFGYTHTDLADLLRPVAVDVTKTTYINGFISQQITNWYQLVSAIHPRLAWLMIVPLRLLTILDPLLTSALRYPYMTVAAVGIKVPSPADSLPPAPTCSGAGIVPETRPGRRSAVTPESAVR